MLTIASTIRATRAGRSPPTDRERREPAPRRKRRGLRLGRSLLAQPISAPDGANSLPEAGGAYARGPRPQSVTAVPLLANCASPAISGERLAMSECRCATSPGAGLVSVPARERNQGSGLSGRGDGRPERAAGLAAGEYRGRDQPRPKTCSTDRAVLRLCRGGTAPRAAWSQCRCSTRGRSVHGGCRAAAVRLRTDAAGRRATLSGRGPEAGWRTDVSVWCRSPATWRATVPMGSSGASIGPGGSDLGNADPIAAYRWWRGSKLMVGRAVAGRPRAPVRRRGVTPV